VPHVGGAGCMGVVAPMSLVDHMDDVGPIGHAAGVGHLDDLGRSGSVPCRQ